MTNLLPLLTGNNSVLKLYDRKFQSQKMKLKNFYFYFEIYDFITDTK